MNTYFDKNHDRYLDPPDPPLWRVCDTCHDMFDVGDLESINDYAYCPNCYYDAYLVELLDDYF